MTKNSIQKPAASQPEPPIHNVRVRTRPIVPVDPPAVPPLRGEPAATSEPPYSVGYGRPPQHTRFQPGRSGNPRGRPKRRKGPNTIVSETLSKTVIVRSSTGEKRMMIIEAVVHKLLEKALKGNVSAVRELLKLYSKYVPRDDLGMEQLDECDLFSRMLAEQNAYLAGLPDGPYNDNLFSIPDENPWEKHEGDGRS